MIDPGQFKTVAVVPAEQLGGDNYLIFCAKKAAMDLSAGKTTYSLIFFSTLCISMRQHLNLYFVADVAMHSFLY